MASNIVSQKNKRLVYGAGLNNCGYKVNPKINGRHRMCPYYQVWHDMLRRCYSNKNLIKRPTYIGCSVADEWLHFTVFKVWMEKQDWKGKCLDKDILAPGNKIYSSKTCYFIDVSINSLLLNNEAARGSLPQGVSFHAYSNQYRAKISINDKPKYLGIFDTISEAEIAYKKAKKSRIIEVSKTQPEPIRSGLLRHAELFKQAEEIE